MFVHVDAGRHADSDCLQGHGGTFDAYGRDWPWRHDGAVVAAAAAAGETWARTDSNASSAWQSAGGAAPGAAGSGAGGLPQLRGRSAGGSRAWSAAATAAADGDDSASAPASWHSPRHYSPHHYSPRHPSPRHLSPRRLSPQHYSSGYGGVSPISGRSRGRSPDTDNGMAAMPRSPSGFPRSPSGYTRSPPLPRSPQAGWDVTSGGGGAFASAYGMQSPGRAYAGLPLPRSAPGPTGGAHGGSDGASYAYAHQHSGSGSAGAPGAPGSGGSGLHHWQSSGAPPVSGGSGRHGAAGQRHASPPLSTPASYMQVRLH